MAFSLEWDDDIPNDKHLFINMEYDVKNDKFTDRPWKYDMENHYERLIKIPKRDSVPIHSLPEPTGELGYLNLDFNWEIHTDNRPEEKQEKPKIVNYAWTWNGDTLQDTFDNPTEKIIVKCDKPTYIYPFMKYIVHCEKHNDDDTEVITAIELI